MSGLKSLTLWIVIFMVFILLWIQFNDRPRPDKVNIIRVFELADQGRLKKVTDHGGKIEGVYVDANGKEQKFVTKYIEGQEDLIFQKMAEAKVEYNPDPQSAVFQQLLLSVVLPIVLLVVLWILIMRQIQSGGSKAMSFGKSRARLVTEGQVKVKFDDVAGVEEAKEELKEVVEYLKDPKRFVKLGAKIPKGVLLYGPPGTGKTLLARAVSGEARVPFLSISGSDFVEMFVGVGASRVRDLFEQAKRQRPCLIFIDEIDAVGRQRFAGIGGGHDEREQTLNQLLVEMDGFNSNEGIILVAATNRPDVLDPAILRPGRFDRRISVDYPDVRGRLKILEVHTKPIKLAEKVHLDSIAKTTPGFSGADLANLVNEAALLAARQNKAFVEQDDFENAKDRVLMGPERRSLVLSEKEKRMTAFHEVGHALCAKLLPDADPVHKVTIIPRGRSLGSTSILPGEERRNHTKKQLENYLVHLLGGRAAEEQMLEGECTTGAANDLQRATDIAHRMVCEFGMSSALGPRTFGEPGNEVFLGKEISRDRNFSEKTAALIDSEVHRIIEEAHTKAKQILSENKDLLVKITEALIERETLDGEELDLLIQGKALPEVIKNEPVDKQPETPEDETAPEKPKDQKPPLGDLNPNFS
jgi:cell division protease FtsH